MPRVRSNPGSSLWLTLFQRSIIRKISKDLLYIIVLLIFYCHIGGVEMATSSITKEFVVKDEAAFAKLKKELDENPASPKKAEESPSLKKGREKLATFVFR